MSEHKRSILIVDDDQVSGTLLQKKLEKRGYETKLVLGGHECLQEISENKYDLILLDIMMPEISGLEVLDEIRKVHDASQFPVIMVTAKNEDSDLVGALKRGANDYLSKPVNIDVAIARISSQLILKDLVKASLSLKQAGTIAKMIGTLNHEINNPLAIAVGNISLMRRDNPDDSKLKKAAEALDRITDLVRKMKEIADTSKQLEEVEYSSGHNIFKID